MLNSIFFCVLFESLVVRVRFFLFYLFFGLHIRRRDIFAFFVVVFFLFEFLTVVVCCCLLISMVIFYSFVSMLSCQFESLILAYTRRLFIFTFSVLRRDFAYCFWFIFLVYVLPIEILHAGHIYYLFIRFLCSDTL